MCDPNCNNQIVFERMSLIRKQGRVVRGPWEGKGVDADNGF